MIISTIFVTLYAWLGVTWTILIGSVLVAYYLYMKKENEYFPKNGIKCMRTYIPLVGNTLGVLTQQEHMYDLAERLYQTFPEEKYFGFRNFNQRLIVVRDLELLKQLTIKNFDHFADHMAQIDPDIDPLFGKSILSLHGQKWRDMRSTLSPAFTSSKMRGMFEFVNECGDEMAKYLLKEALEQKNEKYYELELKDTFSKYTNDVIATSAFGVTINSLKEKDNAFYRVGKQLTTLSKAQVAKLITFLIFPRLVKMFKLNVFGHNTSVFIKNLVNDSMKMREEQKIVRNDMIHLLMEAKKGTLKHEPTKNDVDGDAGFATVEESDAGKQNVKREWTNDELIAQAAIFFFAGFETGSALLSFMGFELAKHPQIQKRLQNEVDEVAAINKGVLKYDDLKHMKYLDMVVSETLRRWPPAGATDRKCVKQFTLPPSNDKTQTEGQINVGDGIWIPIYGIHMDPRFYKNPKVFDPERFSEENRHEIDPMAFLPFGVGPRNCIGSRFALMETKAIVFHIMRHFDIVPTPKTVDKLVFKNSFTASTRDGIWVGLKPRVK